MKYAIIADIHANLEAWQAVKICLDAEKPQKIICLGDIIGYGADPVKCLKGIEAACDHIVAGNHDRAVCGLFDPNLFNSYARQSVYWTHDILSENHKEYLKKLPLTLDIGNFTCTHASLYHPDEFNYILNLDAAAMTFAKLKSDICFIGHSHAPAIIKLAENGDISYIEDQKITLTKGEKYIINVGSVGQPRDGNPKACYCLYEASTKIVELRRAAYDVALAQRKIVNAHLPYFLSARLAGGR